MPEETCPQTLKLVEHDITTLCATCLNRPGCADAVATELIDRLTPPGVRRIFLFSDCDNYEEDPKAKDAPTRGNLGPQLFKADIADRCCSCPGVVKEDCLTRHSLDRLTEASIARGGFLRGQVVCCDMTQMLVQLRPVAKISEPPAK